MSRLFDRFCYVCKPRCLAFAGVNLFCIVSSLFSATTYRYSIVARDGDVIGGKKLTIVGLSPVLKNDGTVVFQAEYDGGSGIFTPNAAVVKTGDVIGGETLTFFTDPSINNRGTIAFIAYSSVPAPLGVFTQTSVLARPGDVIDGTTVGALQNPTGIPPALNARGTVAFRAINGLFTQDDVIAKLGDVIDGKTLLGFGDPTLNDKGTVVFPASYSGGSGLFFKDRLVVKEGDTIGGRTLIGFQGNRAALNNQDTIAFNGIFSTATGESQGIFTQDELIVEAGDVIEGKELTGFGYVDIAENGAVFFQAEYLGGNGLFTPEGAVIKTGDVVDGHTVFTTNFQGGLSSRNPRGQIALTVFFDDNSSAIVLASPIHGK